MKEINTGDLLVKYAKAESKIKRLEEKILILESSLTSAKQTINDLDKLKNLIQ